jgi:hypothetical protein
MLEIATESPASGARFVGRVLLCKACLLKKIPLPTYKVLHISQLFTIAKNRTSKMLINNAQVDSIARQSNIYFGIVINRIAIITNRIKNAPIWVKRK